MKKIIAFLISISLIFGIFLFFVDYMATDLSYYNNFHKKYNISKVSNLDEQWIENASSGLVSFIENGDTLEISDYFNEKEISHMKDVYSLFKLDRFFYKSFLIFSIFSFLICIITKKFQIILYIKKYFLKIFFGIVTFFSLLALFFSNSFIYFHKIFFTNDLWILDYETDLMIRILPEEFFLNMFLNIIILFSISVFVIYIILKNIKIKKVYEF